MRNVSIIGVGSTKCGKSPQHGIQALAVEACQAALRDAGVSRERVQAFYLGNFVSQTLTGQGNLSAIVAHRLGLVGVPVATVEGACASGGIALRQGWLMIVAGMADVVLVAGVEKMTGVDTAAVTKALMQAGDLDTEIRMGLTFPAAFGLIMNQYMYQYGATREQIAAVSIKNRAFGMSNPKAQFRTSVSLDDILSSPLIADPLRKFDCCPISDGAAAAVLCASELAPELSGVPVRIIGSGHANGPVTLYEAEDITAFEATCRAAQQAYSMAGIGPHDVDLAEVHDCFTIAEVIATEDLGFAPKGEGGAAAADGFTGMNGVIPVNPSGGLLTKGHPIGATGLMQIYELVQQLRGQAANQVPGAEIGLAHNLGGAGAVSTVHILQKAA